MNFTELVSIVFYKNLSDRLKLFVYCLKFSIKHNDLNTYLTTLLCTKKHGITIMLFQDEQLASEHNPEL